MSKYTKKLPKNAVVPVVRGKFDYWVPIEDIREDDANSDIYNYDSVADIANSIVKDGLEHCPVVWKDSTDLTSGHSRVRALQMKGFTHVPVIEHDEVRPDSEYERIKRLHVSNMYREMKFGDRYRGIKRARDAYLNETCKIMGTDEMNDLLSDWRVKNSDWNNMEVMRQKYPVFYNHVLSGEMGVRDAYKQATQKKVKMRMAKDLSGLLGKQDVNYLISSICQTIEGIKTLDTGIIGLGNTFTPLAVADMNFYSNVIHTTTCAYMAHKLCSFSDFANDWTVTDNQNAYHDVWSGEDDTGIEIKTHQCGMGETPRWTPKRFKEGYHLLIATSKPNNKGEIESIFIGFGKLDLSRVKQINGGKVEIIPDKLWELHQKGEFEVWAGKMSVDSDGKINFRQALTK
jgi:hypothetical protein